ncbi:MAG: transcriptional repressor [Actinobacteria bacterium]|nr:transcriptional repressor [Actinomycetota bacterium]
MSALGRAGFRAGEARRTVVSLLGEQTCCLTAQEIFDLLRQRGDGVGVASVYRTLDLLVEQNLVQRLQVDPGSARYERIHDAGDHHHHLVCDDCGKVEAFSDDSLELAIDAVAGSVGYTVQGHDVVLRGACGDCR